MKSTLFSNRKYISTVLKTLCIIFPLVRCISHEDHVTSSPPHTPDEWTWCLCYWCSNFKATCLWSCCSFRWFKKKKFTSGWGSKSLIGYRLWTLRVWFQALGLSVWSLHPGFHPQSNCLPAVKYCLCIRVWTRKNPCPCLFSPAYRMFRDKITNGLLLQIKVQGKVLYPCTRSCLQGKGP